MVAFHVKPKISAGPKGVPIMATDNEYIIIFVMWFRHYRTGKIVRSKDGRPIPLKVRKRR